MNSTQKCAKCKKLKPLSAFGERKFGGKLKTCKICVAKENCECGIRKRYCDTHGGTSLCEHKRQKSHCTECTGIHLCKCGKIKYACRTCGGTSICVHKKQKTTCKECNGSARCACGKIKYYCKKCDGSGLCKPHGIRKDLCVKCGGKGICPHKLPYCLCIECGGISRCIHGPRKDQCSQCGTAFCEHKSWKQSCITCHPEKACQECKKVFVRKINRFHPYCSACFFEKFPDNKEAREYRIKEKFFVKKITEAFPNIDMRFNKTVPGGCSQKRPDIFVEFDSYNIGIENDELIHPNETVQERRARNILIWKDGKCKPLYMIRFNPDAYSNTEEKFDSCFSFKEGKMIVDELEWERRFSILSELIQDCLTTEPDEPITEHVLFYGSRKEKLKSPSTFSEEKMTDDKVFCMAENKKLGFRYVAEPKSLKEWSGRLYQNSIDKSAGAAIRTIFLISEKSDFTYTQLAEKPSEMSLLEVAKKYKACCRYTYAPLSEKLKAKIIEHLIDNNFCCSNCEAPRTKDDIFAANNKIDPRCPDCLKTDKSKAKSGKTGSEIETKEKQGEKVVEILKFSEFDISKVSLKNGVFYNNIDSEKYSDLLFDIEITYKGYEGKEGNEFITIPIDNEISSVIVQLMARFKVEPSLMYDDERNKTLLSPVSFSSDCVLESGKSTIKVNALHGKKYSGTATLHFTGIDKKKHLLCSIVEIDLKKIEKISPPKK